MNEKLAESLIEVGVLIPGVEVEVHYHAKGLSGNIDTPVIESFFIRKVLRTSSGKYLFDCSSTVAERMHRFDASNILKIDGMEPARIADVYNLKPNGDPKKRGNKRGRKNKSELAILAASL